MSKKLHSKLLSVILVIAICCATVFGCMLNVSAASEYDGTYTINVGDEKTAVPFGANKVTAQVKFDLTAGFSGGEFTIVADSSYTIGSVVTAVDGTRRDGGSFDASTVEINTSADGSNLNVMFWCAEAADYYTSITFEYTINMTSYVGTGHLKSYPVSINVDGANFAVEYDYADVTFAASGDSDTLFHAHYAWSDVNSLNDLEGNSVTYTSSNDGKHTIATGLCHVCEKVNSDSAYCKNIQVFPDYTEFDGAETIYNSSVGWMGVSGITVDYNSDGTVNVNVHAYSQHYTGNVFLLVTDDEGNEIMRTDNVANGTSHLKGDSLHADAKMFTLSNISARDINEKMLFTLVALYKEDTDGDSVADQMQIHHSRTIPFSLATYAQAVVEDTGKAIWPNGADAKYIEADKDVAAALYYYGAAIDDSVFDKNTGSGSSDNIEYVNTKYYEWDGSVADELSDQTHTGETADDSILIYDPSELAYLVLGAGGTTAKKYYKIAEPNTVFNLNGMLDVSISSTVSDVQKATVNQNWVTPADNTNCFQGNFDGNGLIVYNLYNSNPGSGGNAGLFARTRTYSGTVIKNITVTASYLASFHYVGGIIGYAEQQNTGGKLTVDSCVVKNSYIGYSGGGSGNKWVGSIVGNGVFNALEITNCLVKNNKLESPSANRIGGFTAGAQTKYNGSSSVSNSIAIGVQPYTVNDADGVALPTYTNVFTNQSVDDTYTGITSTVTTGEGAADAMGLDSSVWLDTASYPELSIFHKLAKISVDEKTHKIVCVLKAGDNTCDLKGITEEHNLIANDEGTEKVCECGYTEKIISKIEYTEKSIVTWTNGDQPTSATLTGSGSSEDPYMITTPAEFYYVAMQAGAASAGYCYEVDPNIGVFDMNNNGFGYTGNAFQGTFNGNGVEIINFNTGGWHSGLFPLVKGNVTIENIKITGANYKASGDHAGAIVGTYSQTANINISNCIVTDSTINAKGRAGVMVGSIGNQSITVNNCFVANNTVVANCENTPRYEEDKVTEYTPERYAVEYPQNAVIGYGYNGTRVLKNSIVIGNDPSIRVSSVSNIYTDITPVNSISGITILTDSQLKGANALGEDNMNLSSDVWFATDSYPELKAFHKLADEYVDETTHKPICTIKIDGVLCTTCGVAEEHTLLPNADGTANVCTCGYSEEIISKIDYVDANYDDWDGTRDTTFNEGDGSEDDPYIIETAEQLAGLLLTPNSTYSAVNTDADTTNDYYDASGSSLLTDADTVNSAGKYYQVKANSVFNMNGMENVNINSDVNTVKAAQKDSSKNWLTVSVRKTGNTWSDQSKAFSGHFDGNGLIVYNLYSNGGYAGLFPYMTTQNTGNTGSVKNVAVYASYIKGYHYAGGIVGYGGDVSTSAILNVDNCAVKNCYISDDGNTNSNCNRTSGLVVGYSEHNRITINNCIAINNDTTATDRIGGFVGNTATGTYPSNGVIVKNSISIGSLPYPTLNDGSTRTLSSYTTDPNNYTNVYTDQTFDSATYTGISAVGSSAADMGLDSSVWFDTDTYPELRVFHKLANEYVDNASHKLVCSIIIDGTQCSTCGSVQSHTMVEDTENQIANCECGYSYELKGVDSLDIPPSILKRIKDNQTFVDKFSTNAKFTTAYGADNYHEITDEDCWLYATSLNLKVNPHIAFTFVFNKDYKADRGNITVTFTTTDGSVYTTEAVETDGTLGTNWVNNTGAGRYHLYRLKELPVTKLCQRISVRLNYGDETRDFGSYSAAGYAISAMSAGADYVNHVNAAMALVYYSEMLAARYGA